MVQNEVKKYLREKDPGSKIVIKDLVFPIKCIISDSLKASTNV